MDTNFSKKLTKRGVGWEEVAIVIAESNKEGFQYLQTGFYSSSSNDYCCSQPPKRKNLGIKGGGKGDNNYQPQPGPPRTPK